MAVYKRPGIYISEVLLPAPITNSITAQAAGMVAAPFAQGPTTVTLVNSWYDFTRQFGGYNSLFPATFSVSLFFQNGGRELYVKRIIGQAAVAATAVVPRSAGAGTVMTLTAKNQGTDGNNYRVQLSGGSIPDTFTVAIYKEGTIGTPTSIADDILVEQYENLVFNTATSNSYAPTVINSVSQLFTATVSDNVNAPSTAIVPFTGGSNGNAVIVGDYEATTTGVPGALELIDRPLVVFLPGIYEMFTESAATQMAANISGYVGLTKKDFFVGEVKEGRTVAQALTTADILGGVGSYGAVYYPHLLMADPLGVASGATRKVGPAGAVAGLYLRTDATVGPFKAPAGLTANIAGVVATEKSFTTTELDSLNGSAYPVNPIRQVPGAGLSVMGARTLKQDGTANKYVNMRRSLIYIRKSLQNLTEFALFENNNEQLWGRINTTLNTFLNEYRNQGGLRGNTPADAYFIKCDAENNTAASIASGEVRIEVGVALQYPAEFVVINLSQKTLN
jgi:phage tail sheath protein FI